MSMAKDLHKTITKKFGSVLDLKKKPELLQELLDEAAKTIREKSPVSREVPPASPFGVSWMDSWVGTWIVADKLTNAKKRDEEFASVLQGLVDAKFDQRIAELKRFVRDNPTVFSPPDGGTPEPGVPPVGPAGSGGFGLNTPDGGPPEPGTPPVGPAGGFASEPPDGGTPEPGVPDPPGPSGPDGGLLRDNPWILLWFVSLQAPMIIDMIDAHFTRRLNDLRGR